MLRGLRVNPEGVLIFKVDLRDIKWDIDWRGRFIRVGGVWEGVLARVEVRVVE
jgi:hypothetical protein